MTITTQAVREMAERLGVLAFDKSAPAKVIEAAAFASDMLVALVEERDRLAAQIAFYEQLTETRNGEVRHLTDRAEAAEKMLAAVRDDAMKADNLLCAMEARAEAAEAALRDLRSSVKLVRDEMRSDASIDTEDWETVLGDAITNRAALQGRAGDG